MTYSYIKSLYDDIMTMVSSIVVKRNDLAKANETTDSFKAFELYLSCINGKCSFFDFSSFAKSVLEQFMDETSVAQCEANPNLIPTALRSEIVTAQAAYVIANYVETNDYYRMLNGLPPYAETVNDYIYITDHSTIDPDTPIHKLTDAQIALLTSDGTIAKLIANNIDAEYLKYLGSSNRVAILTARLARPFDILRLAVPSNTNTEDMFRSEYYKARRYIMARTYHDEYYTTKTLYDPIMGMMIAALAIRNTLVVTEKEYLNFEEVLDAILTSYGLLKYFQKFPFSIKRRLVLALDDIIAIKGTDGVLVDICKLFDFDDFTVNRYYLLKTHAIDSDGKIIFNDDPNIAYDIQFIKANVENKEIEFKSENIMDYETVVTSDPLWQLTDAEKTAIMGDEFNLMMTKYIDIEAAYDLTELVFEVCCFTNLLLYARNNLSKINCPNKYATAGYSPVFTMVVFWLAGMAKRSNFDGNIVYSPNDMAEIMQFNYGDISATVTALVNKYNLRVDVADTLLSDYDITDVTLTKPSGYISVSDSIAIYVKNRTLYEAIMSEMAITEDEKKYMVLAQLKDLLFTASMQKDTFKKSDGTSANTYYEMLKDLDPVLTTRLDSTTTESDLNNLLIYILEKLEETFTSDNLHYLFLNTPTAYGALMNDYLEMAINVFKASTVQLASINVYFYLGDHDPIRVIDEKYTNTKAHLYDTATITDSFSIHEHLYINDTLNIADKPYIT